MWCLSEVLLRWEDQSVGCEWGEEEVDRCACEVAVGSPFTVSVEYDDDAALVISCSPNIATQMQSRSGHWCVVYCRLGWRCCLVAVWCWRLPNSLCLRPA